MTKTKALNVVPEAEAVKTGVTDTTALAEALAGALADYDRAIELMEGLYQLLIYFTILVRIR